MLYYSQLEKQPPIFLSSLATAKAKNATDWQTKTPESNVVRVYHVCGYLSRIAERGLIAVEIPFPDCRRWVY